MSALLKELDVGWLDVALVPDTSTSAASGFCAMEVSRLCPLLERVDLTENVRSPRENLSSRNMAAAFPAIKMLNFNVVGGRHMSQRGYDRIEATLEERACARADEINLSFCNRVAGLCGHAAADAFEGSSEKVRCIS